MGKHRPARVVHKHNACIDPCHILGCKIDPLQGEFAAMHNARLHVRRAVRCGWAMLEAHAYSCLDV